MDALLMQLCVNVALMLGYDGTLCESRKTKQMLRNTLAINLLTGRKHLRLELIRMDLREFSRRVTLLVGFHAGSKNQCLVFLAAALRGRESRSKLHREPLLQY